MRDAGGGQYNDNTTTRAPLLTLLSASLPRSSHSNMDTSAVVSQARGLRQHLSTASCHNPFVNYTTAQPHTLYENLKLLIGGIVLLPARVLVLLLVGVLSWLVARASQLGRSPEELEQPPSAWRRLLVQPIPYLLRVAMFACGLYWIPVKGRPAPPSEAPLVVCNHRSFLEPMYLFYALGGPIGVAKAGVVDIPIAGPIARCLQPILVHREDRTKSRQAGEAIVSRARSGAWPHILIFPEGTCTNGTALIAFRNGAFAAGVPVQPVRTNVAAAFRTAPPATTHLSVAELHRSLYGIHIRTLTPAGSARPPCCTSWSAPCARYDALSWSEAHRDARVCGACSLSAAQFANFMEVEYLPVYKPSEEEQRNPSLYANNVRQGTRIAQHLPHAHAHT